MRIADVLKERNMTVRELSRLTGISVRTLELYTSGRRQLSTAYAKTVILIADALKIHPRDLID